MTMNEVSLAINMPRSVNKTHLKSNTNCQLFALIDLQRMYNKEKNGSDYGSKICIVEIKER
jgi:hypothetical protein